MNSKVTVVVVPRERFSFARESLESVCDSQPPDTPLIYVDGASPAPVAKYLAAAARARGFRYLRTTGYVSPNQARNIGLREVRTPFVAFVDNDVIVSPGWLEYLLECAEDTGAAVVGPLYVIDVGGDISVHMAGGDAHITDDAGVRMCHERHHHVGVSPAAAAGLGRTASELVEFHAVLIRTALFAEIGPLDEDLWSVNEHVDLCMLTRARGQTVYIEPKSVVTYVPATRLRISDLPFFMLRWSERWNKMSAAHFNTKWALDTRHPSNLEILSFGRFHRWRGLRLLGEATVDTWPARARRRAVVLLERFVNAAYVAVASV